MLKAVKDDKNCVETTVSGMLADIITEFDALVNHLLKLDIYSADVLIAHVEMILADRRRKEQTDGEFEHL